jgi:hypothetical protein
MSTLSVSCPHCGNGLKAPDRYAGKQVKCLQCKTSFTLSAASPAEDEAPGHPVDHPTTPSPAGGPAVTGAARLAFWMGLAGLALGLAAGVCGFFQATVGSSRALAWLGILLAGGAVVLAILREECGFALPFIGSATSLLSLALVAFWLGAPRGPGEGPGGFPGGPPGGPPGDMRKGPPPDWKGGPPPDWKGGPPGEKGRGGPPPPPPQQ